MIETKKKDFEIHVPIEFVRYLLGANELTQIYTVDEETGVATLVFETEKERFYIKHD